LNKIIKMCLFIAVSENIRINYVLKRKDAVFWPTCTLQTRSWAITEGDCVTCCVS